MTTAAGWQQLIPAADLFRGAGRYPIDAYSEFMPPPQLGWKPYGGGFTWIRCPMPKESALSLYTAH